MPVNVTPRRLQESVHMGFRRLANFRRARLMYLRSFVGQYYDQAAGSIGTEPMNLMFNAVRILVPNLIMTLPKHDVESKYLAYREYGELLGMGLDYSDKELNMKDILRRWVVDSIFTMGILKTGLCESNRVAYFDETDGIDPGTIFTELVDFGNWVVNPNCRDLDNPTWVGDRIRVPRQQLLDSGRYENDLIIQLPTAGTEIDDGSERLSRRNINRIQRSDIQDTVDVVELWV